MPPKKCKSTSALAAPAKSNTNDHDDSNDDEDEDDVTTLLEQVQAKQRKKMQRLLVVLAIILLIKIYSSFYCPSLACGITFLLLLLADSIFVSQRIHVFRWIIIFSYFASTVVKWRVRKTFSFPMDKTQTNLPHKMTTTKLILLHFLSDHSPLLYFLFPITHPNNHKQIDPAPHHF